MLAPILPGITDSTESIEAVASAAAEHGATFFGATALRLMPIVKEHYLGFVEAAFPALLPRYQRAYPGTYAPRDYLKELAARVDLIRARYGFDETSMRMRQPPAPGRPLPAWSPEERPALSQQMPLPI